MWYPSEHDWSHQETPRETVCSRHHFGATSGLAFRGLPDPVWADTDAPDSPPHVRSQFRHLSPWRLTHHFALDSRTSPVSGGMALCAERGVNSFAIRR